MYVKDAINIMIYFISEAQTVFEPCCIFCGDIDNTAENEAIEALREEFSIVRPICNTCYDSGKKPVTRMGKKGRKRGRRVLEEED
jgi:hypothetical protein